MALSDRVRNVGDRVACGLICAAGAVGLALYVLWLMDMPALR